MSVLLIITAGPFISSSSKTAEAFILSSISTCNLNIYNNDVRSTSKASIGSRIRQDRINWNHDNSRIMRKQRFCNLNQHFSFHPFCRAVRESNTDLNMAIGSNELRRDFIGPKLFDYINNQTKEHQESSRKIKHENLQTKSELLEQKHETISRREMTNMSILGVAFTGFLFFSLTNDPSSDFSFEKVFSSSNNEFNLEAVEKETLMEVETVTQRVLNSAIPASATDVVSVAFGEGVAGSIGALLNVAIIYVMELMKRNNVDESASLDSESNRIFMKQGQSSSKITSKRKGEINESGAATTSLTPETASGITEAVADGDYFLTRAAALPLLGGIGIPAPIASVVSVLFATIPYEFIKLYSRRQQIEENKDSAKKEGLEIDFVDIFADTTKWLEYTVLSSDFETKFIPGNPIIESASYGALAAFSSQMYADMLYRYTDYGSKTAKANAANRTSNDFASIYFSKALKGAILFGTYEYARLPITRFFQSILTGGVDSCMGSSEFDVCIETFFEDNPPSDIASTEAQLRALFTALVGLGDRVGLSFNGDDFFVVDNLEGNVRSLAVSFYSLLNHFLPLY